MSQINKVSKKELREAIDYLYSGGFIDEMTTDKKYYTSILLKHAGNTLELDLIDLE